MKRIGVLALQGAVREHLLAIEACGAKAVPIKKPAELIGLDALVLPGGESTAMRRLIERYRFIDPLREFAKTGKPMLGTCAGLILLAREVEGYDEPHLGVMDVKVERNSFGRQIDSFEADLEIKGFDASFNAVFIRAPHIISAGPDTEVLCEYDGKIVMARHAQFLGCSFHPELTLDYRITEYFMKMISAEIQSLQA
ncbi:pyridoxal 5'-phosphate synthase glutaminase subunit PdxT [Planomicrobium okeanokoites]|uniref:Pyridoxal 5'-phosphate synthase subunit PdxT n=1 Tax=Planomicrobium okeanokoites TaxID=244 RepID=A0ABV7KRP3_PLAOK|nr:pyridoxal 5'-phosphate synthase glutaminase subunit PdxT [Planomicrobium okeanokoites]TAA69988.1 pyridoxal 5'-phosphate synthase glutaminase subunit PdxT [Planomicrobium okeanokoites]